MTTYPPRSTGAWLERCAPREPTLLLCLRLAVTHPPTDAAATCTPPLLVLPPGPTAAG